MKTRALTMVINTGIFVLLVVLVAEAAGIRRSLRRMEREEHLHPVRYAVPWMGVKGVPVWYLLQPPVQLRSNDILWQAPLILWDLKKSFQTSSECWLERRRIAFDACPQWGESRAEVDTLRRALDSGSICIAADDPAYSAWGHFTDVEKRQEQIRCML